MYIIFYVVFLILHDYIHANNILYINITHVCVKMSRFFTFRVYRYFRVFCLYFQLVCIFYL